MRISDISELLMSDDVPRPVIEIIEKILSYRDKLTAYEGCRGTLYIDYAPGDVKLRIDKLGLEPVDRVALA